MTALLVNLSSFVWAKKFMTSQVWNHTGDLSSGLHFTLQDKCPVLPSTSCLRDLPDLDKALVLEDPLDLKTKCASPPSQKGKGKAFVDTGF